MVWDQAISSLKFRLLIPEKYVTEKCNNYFFFKYILVLLSDIKIAPGSNLGPYMCEE